MTHPFLQGLEPTMHISHRGGAALAPENTLLAFRMAVLRYRTQMLELDVHATRDGELVVAHDATLDRCTNAEGPIADRSLSELAKIDAGYRFSADGGRTFPYRGQGVRIPRLVEVLEEFDVRLNIEAKIDGLEPPLAGLIRAANASRRVCVGSEIDSVAERLYEALPEACHFYPREALARAVVGLRSGEPLDTTSPYIVLDMPLHFQGVRLVNQALLEGARHAGRWVNVWTVDDPDEMRRLRSERVGGIMTDRPDLLRAVLDAPEV